MIQSLRYHLIKLNELKLIKIDNFENILKNKVSPSTLSLAILYIFGPIYRINEFKLCIELLQKHSDTIVLQYKKNDNSNLKKHIYLLQSFLCYKLLQQLYQQESRDDNKNNSIHDIILQNLCKLLVYEENWEQVIEYIYNFHNDIYLIEILQLSIPYNTFIQSIKKKLLSQRIYQALFTAIYREQLNNIELQQDNRLRYIKLLYTFIPKNKIISNDIIGIPFIHCHDICLSSINRLIRELQYDNKIIQVINLLQYIEKNNLNDFVKSMFNTTSPGPLLYNDIVEYTSIITLQFDILLTNAIANISLQSDEQLYQLFQYGPMNTTTTIITGENRNTLLHSCLNNTLYIRSCIIREFISLQQYIVWISWVIWWSNKSNYIPNSSNILNNTVQNIPQDDMIIENINNSYTEKFLTVTLKLLHLPDGFLYDTVSSKQSYTLNDLDCNRSKILKVLRRRSLEEISLMVHLAFYGMFFTYTIFNYYCFIYN